MNDLKKIEMSKPKVSHYEEHLTPALIKILKALTEKDVPATTEKLANWLDRSRNVISGYLNRLEQHGYIRRIPNLGDTYSGRYLFQVNPEKLLQEVRELLRL
jgi:predicted transcriptional regulator